MINFEDDTAADPEPYYPVFDADPDSEYIRARHGEPVGDGEELQAEVERLHGELNLLSIRNLNAECERDAALERAYVATELVTTCHWEKGVMKMAAKRARAIAINAFVDMDIIQGYNHNIVERYHRMLGVDSQFRRQRRQGAYGQDTKTRVTNDKSIEFD